MHQQAYEYVKRTVESLPARASVVEIGSYNVNGTVRDLFPGIPYTGVDTRHGPDVDVVIDGALYVTEQRVDTVVCCSVLEHAENAADVIQNACTMLGESGLFIMTAAGVEWPPHGVQGGSVGEEFYCGVGEEQLVEWIIAAGFDSHQIERTSDGDIFAVAVKVAGEGQS